MSLQWTSAPPTRPGFYWLRVVGEFAPEVVRISELEGALRIFLCGSEQALPLGGAKHEWAGPLNPPS